MCKKLAHGKLKIQILFQTLTAAVNKLWQISPVHVKQAGEEVENFMCEMKSCLFSL